MAFDANKMRELMETGKAKPEPIAQPIEESTTWTQDRMAELNTEIEDSVLEETYTFDPEESRQNFNAIGTLVSNTFNDIARAETDYVMAEQGGDEEEIERARVNAIRAPFKESAREIIAAYGDDNKSPFQSFAQGLRQSSANIEYFMSDEERLAKAREIGDALNIPAGALMADTEAMQNAMGAYDYAKKIEAAGGSMEKVYQDFPKLAEIAGMDPQAAALALHDLHHIREVRDVTGAWKAFWQSGEDSYDYGVLKAKDALEGLTDEEKERAEALRKSMENAPVAPSFFVNPALAMLSGVQSLPEMIYSGAKAVPYAVTGGVIGAAAVGAPTFGAGAPAGFMAGAKKGFDVGMYIEMARPMMGRKYAEYQAMTDENGNRRMTDAEARERAIAETIPEALIELGGFKLGVGKAALGEHAKKVVAEAMQGFTKPTARRAALGLFGESFKGVFETGLSEMGEEFLQEFPSALMEADIARAKNEGNMGLTLSGFGETLEGAKWDDITKKAAAQALEAAPGAFFLGGFSNIAGAPMGGIRYGLESSAWNRQFGDMAKTERTTMTGTVMLEQLQAAVHDSNLQETAPDVQREILRDELKDTPWQIAYVDVETALKNESGLDDVREAGKAAGMTDEEIQQAIEEKGTIAVPLESYAQSAASSNLLDSVSFSPDAEPLAKIRENAKATAEAYTKRMTEEVNKQIDLTEAMTKELFPEQQEQDTAMMAIYQNPENPAQGWKELYEKAIAERDEILAPALAALGRGMGNGVDIVENQDGTTGRVSNNEEWYRKFYAEHKRKPNKEEMRDMARKMMLGEPDAPQVQGWTISDKETAEAMANEKDRLAAADHEVEVLESIRERMQEMNGAEMQLTAGMTPEAYKVYRAITTDLLKFGGKPGRAARVSALLWARHADVYAKRMRTKPGFENYTATDWLKNTIRGIVQGRAQGYNQANVDNGTILETLDQFAGENAETADKMKLAEAERMEAEGKAPDEIYKATGWFKGLDGKWRFEIPDNLDKIDLSELENGREDAFGYSLGRIYDNPALYEAYPWLAEIPVVKASDMLMTTQAAVTNKYGTLAIELNANRMDDARIKNSLVHEIQHLIQMHEGFAAGGSSETVREQILAEIRRLARSENMTSDEATQYASLMYRFEQLSTLSGHEEEWAESLVEISKYEKTLPKEKREIIKREYRRKKELSKAYDSKESDDSLYYRLGGEQEARKAAARANGHTRYEKAKKRLTDAEFAFAKLRESLPEAERAQVEEYLAARDEARKASREEARHEGMEDEEQYTQARKAAWDKESDLEAALPENVLEALQEISNAEWSLSFGKEALQELPKPHERDALIVFGGEEMPYSQNVDNLGNNGDNSRGSDIVDERTAREIEREKPAVREQYEGTPGWMKAPNGKDTNLTEEQWLAARTKAFRRKYGHWDYDGSERVGGVDISHSNLAKKDGTPIDLNNTHDVEEWVRQNIQGASVTVNRDGTVVGFSRRGLSDGVSKARDRGIGRDKNNRLLFAKLQEIIQKSAYFDFREADGKHNRRHVLGQDIYQAYMKAGDSHYRVELMLDVKPDQAVTYKGHQAYKIKIEPAVYHTQAENSGAYARTSSNFTISLDDLMEGVKPKEPKIPLDENGEPIFSDIPGTPDTERKPAPEREKLNTAQAQSRSEHQGGFSDARILDTLNQAVAQGNLGRTVSYSDGTKLVELFESADESTFLHESGHIFLMDLEELAAEGDEASKADLALVDQWAAWHDGDEKKYAGTPWAREFAERARRIREAEKNGVAKMPDGTTRTKEQLLREWRQERFARAFEIYLYDGKAPSKGLRGVFRKFCEFLKQVYMAITSDGARASAQVEAVMGRLLATDEEIEATEQDERYKDFMAAGGEKLMYEDAEETFSRWHEEAKEEARDKLRKIVMRSLTGKRGKKRKEILREERVRKETELSNQPVYLARQAAKETGIRDAWRAYFPGVEGEQNWKEADSSTPTMEEALEAYMRDFEANLDRKETQASLTEEAIEAAMSTTQSHEKLLRMEQRAFAKKAALADRLSVKTRARLADVEKWIDEMPDAIDGDDMGTWNRAINSLKLANRWTKEELDAIDRLSVSASQEAAKENFEALRKIMKERKVGLADLRETNRGRVDALRKQAKETIARQTLAQATQVQTHRKEEKEAAKEAARLAKKEQWAEAAAAKERELLAAFMAAEAEKVRNRRDAILKRIRTQINAKTKLPKDERYWHQHLAYLLRATDKDAAKPDGLKSLAEIAKSLGEGLDVATDDDGRSDILDLMQKLTDEGAYKDGYHGMRLEEFEDAADVLTVLYTTGRDKFNLKLTQGKTIEEAVDEILSDRTAYNGAEVARSTVTGNPNRGGVFWSETLSRIPGAGDALAKYAQRYGLSLTKPEELINLLGEKAHKYIYDIYDRAAEKEAAMTADFCGKMEAILSKRYKPEEMREWQARKYQWRGQPVSKENILAMAMNLGNEINMDRLVMGLEANPAELEKFIADHMTEKDWLFCQDVWDLLHEYWPETVRVEMELNGTRLKPQEARALNVRTKDAKGNEKELKLSGGYYPIKYDPELSTKSREQSENAEAAAGMSGAVVLGMGRGFTKDRAAKGAVKNRPLLLDLSVIPQHVGEAVHNITTRIAARDVYRIINNGEMKDHILNTMGQDAYNVLTKWATDVWKIKPEEKNGAENLINGAIRRLRQNSGIAIMGYRMWPTIENATNIFPMMDALGAAETLSAMKDYYTNRKEYDELIAKSLFMRERTERMDRDMKGQRGMFERQNAVSEWLVKHAYDPITFTDLLTSKPLWARAYKNAFAAKLAEVRKENEENAKTFEKRRAEYDAINATVVDMKKRRQAMQDELKRRQYRQAPKAETEFTRMSSQTLRDEIHILDGEIEDKGKTLFVTGEKMERASTLVIRTERETLDEAEHRAVLAADKAVRDVIGSGDVKDLSEVQRSKNEAVKALTMFYSYFNTQANAIISAHWKGKWQGGAGYDFTPIAKAIAYRFLLTAALSTAMRWLFFGEGNDDKDKYKKDKEGNKIEVPALERALKQYAKNALSTTIGGAYGLREIGNWAINRFIDGHTYGSGARFDGMYGSFVNQVLKEAELILNKSARDEKAREEEEKRQERYRNATPTQRKRMRQDEQYRKPPNTISYADILRGAGSIGASLTAGTLGITEPIANAVLGTMQYIFDSDGRYDATIENMMWSAFWTKKPVKRTPPEKPKKTRRKEDDAR